MLPDSQQVSEEDFSEPVNKGVTRPAMYHGVPLIPFMCGAFGVGTIAMYLDDPFAWLLVIPVFLVMRSISAHDPQQWRLIGLWLWFRVVNFDFTAWFWGSSTYSPNVPDRR